MKKLQVAYSAKEKAENLLKNLNELKEKGSVSEDQFKTLKDEFDHSLTQAMARIEEIKEDLKRRVEGKEAELKEMKKDFEMLRLRSEVGQISATEFFRLKERIQKSIRSKEEAISKLNTLINSQSSSDLGGYIEVQVGKVEKRSDILPSGFPEFSRVSETIADRSALLPLICGIVILIGSFMPWASLGIGYGIRFTDTGLASNQGIIAMLSGLFIIGLAFLKDRYLKIKGIGHLITGGITLLCLISYWSGAPVFGGSLTPGFGFILCLIAAIIVVITGITEYRRA